MKKILILENNSYIEDIIVSYCDILGKRYKTESFDFIKGLATDGIPDDFIQRLNDADIIAFSTIFNQSEGNQKIFKAIGACSKPKEIHIHYAKDRLIIGIGNFLPDDFTPRDYGLDKHKIFEIATRKITKKGTYFNSISYYFDTIPYYWNDEVLLYAPERPECIYHDNLEELYRKKPRWYTNE